MSVDGTNATQPGGALAPVRGRTSVARFILNENALTLLVVLIIACGLLSHNFLSPQNLANLADQMPIFAF